MGPFFGGFVTVVIILVGLVQALAPIFKSIADANAKRNRPPGQQAGVGGRNAVEPDSFLPDMVQQGAPRPAANPGRPPRSPSQGRSQQGRSSQQGRPQRSRKQSGEGAGKASAKPSQGGRSSGTGVGSHVEEFINQHVKSHIGNQIEASVKSDIRDQVKNHLGEKSSPDTTSASSTSHGSAAAADLLTALRSPGGVRQAILMSEILSKPKALRRS